MKEEEWELCLYCAFPATQASGSLRSGWGDWLTGRNPSTLLGRTFQTKKKKKKITSTTTYYLRLMQLPFYMSSFLNRWDGWSPKSINITITKAEAHRWYSVDGIWWLISWEDIAEMHQQLRVLGSSAYYTHKHWCVVTSHTRTHTHTHTRSVCQLGMLVLSLNFNVHHV